MSLLGCLPESHARAGRVARRSGIEAPGGGRSRCRASEKQAKNGGNSGRRRDLAQEAYGACLAGATISQRRAAHPGSGDRAPSPERRFAWPTVVPREARFDAIQAKPVSGRGQSNSGTSGDPDSLRFVDVAGLEARVPSG